MLTSIVGIGGSSLDAQLHKKDSPSWYCFKNWDWFRIWFNVEELLAQVLICGLCWLLVGYWACFGINKSFQKCWFDNLQVTYNTNNQTYSNPYGVETRPTDFGGTTVCTQQYASNTAWILFTVYQGVEYLDYHLGLPITFTAQFANMVKSLVEVGYVRGQNVRGAPVCISITAECKRGMFVYVLLMPDIVV